MMKRFNFKKLISGVLACMMVVTMIPAQSVAAAEQATEKYPYVIFAGGEGNSLDLGKCNLAVNGNIHTNGMLTANENNANINGDCGAVGGITKIQGSFNVRNKIASPAKEETIIISKKVKDTYFTNNCKTYDTAYTKKGANININKSIFSKEAVNLTGDILFNGSVGSNTDITFNGGTLNSNNSVIYSEGGNITINNSNTTVNGLIYAPNGKVTISGQNLLVNGAIIAKEICIDSMNVNINYDDSIAKAVGNTSEIIDSDNDGLPDVFEETQTFTDPKNMYTDGSKITDGDRDEDNDGLTNLQEYKLGTNPYLKDTDLDGLDDKAEVQTYKTDPNKYDTDGDGLNDCMEVNNALNPLKTDTNGNGISDGNEKLTTSLTANKYESINISKIGYTPAIAITGKGDYNSQLSLTDASADPLFPDVDYIVGRPIEIEHDSIAFDNAHIEFKLNDELLKNKKIDNLCIGCYDKDTKQMKLLNTKIDKEKGSLSVDTNHFSYYFIVDIAKWLIDNFINGKTDNIHGGICDIVFAIDTTGSMAGNITNLKNSANKLADELKSHDVNARFGIVEFKDIDASQDGFKSVNHGWFTDVDSFKNEINSLTASGGGDGPESAVDALETARRMDYRNSAIKHIILITDAEYKNNTNYPGIDTMQQVVDNLRTDKISVSCVSNNYLQDTYKLVYNGTNGIFCDINSDFSESLLPVVTKLSDESKKYTWIRLSDGTVVKLNVNPDIASEDDPTDTDGDGIPDMKELGTSVDDFFGDCSYKVWYFHSNPAKADNVDKKSGKVTNVDKNGYVFYNINNGLTITDNVYSAHDMVEGIKQFESYVTRFTGDANSAFTKINIMYYLQDSTYNGIQWELLGIGSQDPISSVNSNLIQNVLRKRGDYFKKYKLASMIDPKTGNEIDFTHMMASCDAHFNYKDSIADLPIELSSWGGDLQTLLADVAHNCNYSDDESTIQKSINSLLSTNSKDSSFPQSDMLADIDAVNLSKKLNSESFSIAFQQYYESGEEYKRYTTFLDGYSDSGLLNKIQDVIPSKYFAATTNFPPVFMLPFSDKTSIVSLVYKEVINRWKEERWPETVHANALRHAFYDYIETERSRE